MREFFTWPPGYKNEMRQNVRPTSFDQTKPETKAGEILMAAVSYQLSFISAFIELLFIVRYRTDHIWPVTRLILITVRGCE